MEPCIFRAAPYPKLHCSQHLGTRRDKSTVRGEEVCKPLREFISGSFNQLWVSISRISQTKQDFYLFNFLFKSQILSIQLSKFNFCFFRVNFIRSLRSFRLEFYDNLLLRSRGLYLPRDKDTLMRRSQPHCRKARQNTVQPFLPRQHQQLSQTYPHRSRR